MANPLNATFFAFRKREKNGVLTRAAVAYLVLAIVLLGAFVAINIQALGPVFSWYGEAISTAAKGGGAASTMQPPPAGFFILFLSILPFMFAFYVLTAAFEAACLRWLVRGESGGGIMGLSFGGDTWRVYLVYWIWFFLYMAFSIIGGIVSAIVLMGAFMSGTRGGDLSTMGPLIGTSLVVRLLLYIVFLYFAVRWAPASAISVARKQFAFFESWEVTKGRFWALLGSFLIVVLIALAIEIVLGVVVFGVAMSGAWSTIVAAGPTPTPEQASAIFAALFTPQNFVVLCGTYVVFLALALVLYVMFYGINARAVIAASEDGKVQIPGIGVAEQFE
jgi:hypothetical protein